MVSWTLAVALLLGLGDAANARALQEASQPAPVTGETADTDDTDEASVVRTEIAALSRGGAKAKEPLAAERRAVLETLAAALELRSLRASAGAAALGPAPPPTDARAPYPVAVVDAARDYVQSLLGEQATLEAALMSLARDEEATLASLAHARQQQRLWDERGRAGGAGKERQLALARADLARWRARQLAMQLSDTREAQRRANERLAAIVAQLAQWQPRIAQWRAQQVLDETGMDRALAEIAGTRAALARRLDTVDARRAASSTAANPWADVAVVLREQDAVLKGREDVWRLRQRSLKTTSQDIAEHRRILDDAIAQLDARLRWAEGQLAFERASPTHPVKDDQSLDAEAALLQARKQLVATIARSMTLLERTREDLPGPVEPIGVAGTVRGWLAELATLAGKVWETELFVVTDRVAIDGREVTREHGITVGKSLGALLLLSLGYACIRWLALPALDAVLHRARVSAGRRRTVARWIAWLLALLLAVVVLKLARIPLVAFAFLGGALAIGIGFGAQTLLRNLMSGLLLLAERKVKVGDVLTIGATSGTCADVGLRATTLHGFDGIDLIIPNSMLLENTIHNWRSREGRIRREVRIFVPYAHPVTEASEIVHDCALAEPALLADPAPEVLLVRLGEGGFELALQFWLRLGAEPSAPTVESRLRFAISLALARAGIEPGWQSSVRTLGPSAPAS